MNIMGEVIRGFELGRSVSLGRVPKDHYVIISESHWRTLSQSTVGMAANYGSPIEGGQMMLLALGKGSFEVVKGSHTGDKKSIIEQISRRGSRDGD